eukprot:12026341-Ditylum_brightwellii.AAC.1
MSCTRVRCCVWDGSRCFFDPDADSREKPSSHPTGSLSPSSMPSATPSLTLSSEPSLRQSATPSSMPTSEPSSSFAPSTMPSTSPTSLCSRFMSEQKCLKVAGCAWSGIICYFPVPPFVEQPSLDPTSSPSVMPSAMPTSVPSISSMPSIMPSSSPTSVCSRLKNEVTCLKATDCAWSGSHCYFDDPSSSAPSSNPSEPPTVFVVNEPGDCQKLTDATTCAVKGCCFDTIAKPSVCEVCPSASPSMQPTSMSSAKPSISLVPSAKPTSMPSAKPSSMPSLVPSSMPTSEPSFSFAPSTTPSASPTSICSRFLGEAACIKVACCAWDGEICFYDLTQHGPPSSHPTVSAEPSSMPSVKPSISSMPSAMPSSSPTSICSRLTSEESCVRVDCCEWDGSFCVLSTGESFNFRHTSNSLQNSNIGTGRRVGYSITFTNRWTGINHPYLYPVDAHWSPFVYASHSDAYIMWRNGGTASRGVELVAEIGNISDLQGELSSNGNVLDQVSAVGIDEAFDGAMSAPSLPLCVDEGHPYVSGIGMIAP